MELIADEPLRRELGNAGRLALLDRFSTTVWATALRTVYDREIRTSDPGSSRDPEHVAVSG
jgi:hypothetical protein